MSVGELQHYTIEPADLEATKDFYCDVLGLTVGPRPPLGYPGYWLYTSAGPTVHLLGLRPQEDGIVVRGPDAKFEHTGRLDHIAFAATDIDGARARLTAKNVKFREAPIPGTNLVQIFVFDPDGVGVELNFEV